MAAEKVACREQLAEDHVQLQGSISEVALEMKDIVSMTDVERLNDNCEKVCPASGIEPIVWRLRPERPNVS